MRLNLGNTEATGVRLRIVMKEKVEHFWNHLNKDSLHLVDEFYAPNVVFEDPLTRIRGLRSLRTHYKKLYQDVLEIRFDFPEMTETEDTVFASWVMTLTTKKLNWGRPYSVEGFSVMTFRDDKVVYHRDYLDLGAMLYERIPILGGVIRWFKSLL